MSSATSTALAGNGTTATGAGARPPAATVRLNRSNLGLSRACTASTTATIAAETIPSAQ
ncbi:MAG TPA: hypothetical protein VHZ33_14615 [Trebonia sp.]|nr:hypothetical protein [Trebonia sp.]